MTIKKVGGVSTRDGMFIGKVAEGKVVQKGVKPSAPQNLVLPRPTAAPKPTTQNNGSKK